VVPWLRLLALIVAALSGKSRPKGRFARRCPLELIATVYFLSELVCIERSMRGRKMLYDKRGDAQLCRIELGG